MTGRQSDDDIIRSLPQPVRTTELGVVIMPEDRSEADADARFVQYGGLIQGNFGVTPDSSWMKDAATYPIAKPREIYLGGKTTEQLKPWLTADQPMSRRTWFRRKAKP